MREAMSGVANEPGAATWTRAGRTDLLSRRLYINYREPCRRTMSRFERVGNGWRMNVSYEVRRPWWATSTWSATSTPARADLRGSPE